MSRLAPHQSRFLQAALEAADKDREKYFDVDTIGEQLGWTPEETQSALFILTRDAPPYISMIPSDTLQRCGRQGRRLAQLSKMGREDARSFRDEQEQKAKYERAAFWRKVVDRAITFVLTVAAAVLVNRLTSKPTPSPAQAVAIPVAGTQPAASHTP